MSNKRGKGEGQYFKDGELFAWRIRFDGRSIVRKAKTQKELRSKVKAALRELEERGTTMTQDERRATVAGWLNTWLAAYVEPHRAKKTHRQYEQLVRLYMVPHIGHIRLVALKGADVQAMLNALKESGKSGATVQLVRVVLRRALNIAMRQRLILGNPVDATERPKVATRRERSMDPAQLQTFLAALQCSKSRYAPVLQLIVSTGLRISEALGVKWSDFAPSPKAPVICLQDRLEWEAGGRWSLAPLKTAASRRPVPLSAVAFEAMQDMAEIQTEDRERLKGASPKHGLVFTTETGSPMTERNVQRALDAILKAAGLPHFSLHDLRRTFATTLANRKVPMHVLKDLMGHESLTTTAGHYTFAYRDDLSSAVGMIRRPSSRHRQDEEESDLVMI